MPDLRLVVDGTSYGGWEQITVRRSIEEIAGGFDIGVSELWPEQGAPREIPTGAKCVVQIDGETVITGRVDAVRHGYDDRSHTVSVQGRDATADLVDCSAVYKKGEWRNARLDQIAKDLAGPFGVGVAAQTDLGAVFPSFAIEPGESAFDCLERAARHRGVMLFSDGIGGLVLGKAGSAGSVATALELGENLLSGRSANDQSDRYSEYVVKGQRAGDDQVFGEAASAVKATAKDAGVARYRPLVILAEDQGDIAGFERRAKWEASVRAARALTVDCAVQGWRHADGLWKPNTLVQYRDPVLRLQRELLVRDVEFRVEENGGTTTSLVLVPREAYTLAPVAAGSGDAFA